ncbi:MAG: membrane protein insertion efficiency factor YidD [Pseudomonadota bacterium]
MRRALAGFISFYQRFLSPYKRFRCAAAYRYGIPSCSAATKTIILDDGLISGRAKIVRQFRRCSAAAEATRKKKKPYRRKRRKDIVPNNEDSGKWAWCADAACASCAILD